VIQSSEGEKSIRQQEVEEERAVRCFKCGEKRHKCRDCPRKREEKLKRVDKKTVCVAKPQNAQQQRRPVYPTWKKAQKYCVEENALPEGALLLERGWISDKVVVMYVEYKGIQVKRSGGLEEQETGVSPQA